MTKIARVDVCLARVPLSNPINFSTRTVRAREYCLVRITGEDGKQGLGYSYAVNNSGALLADAAREILAPQLIGDESTRVEGIWRELYQETLLIGRVGVVMRALSAIDIALWDLSARSVGLPLNRYLGSCVLDRVPAYGSGGYYWPGKDNRALAEEAQAFVAAGHKAIKIKTGRLSPGEEEERLAAVREATGPDVEIMLDANNAWPDLATAMRYVKRLEKYDPYWIEEPFLPDDIDSHALLAERTPVMLATGEVEAGRWRFKDLVERRAAQIIMPDAIVCGGVTEWRRIAAMAACYGIQVSPHAWHDVHVHLVASAPNASWVEFMPDDHVVNFRLLIDRQLKLENGDLLLPQEPGLGFAFDEAAIERYGVAAPDRKRWRAVKQA
ncbi:mandelate racemase/muconate lactonizing enzyme family protein [Bradyrhizobium erythrophlei]|uniref:mandelate racemase/muconate lactonizing enzyme family protein n=1 Tax=Bradyrhizobium erythrophlei TaxID=1437360 RepID=UPI0035F0CE40